MRITRLCALLLALTLLLLPSCSQKKTEEPEPPEADIEEAANGPSVLFLSAETDPDLLTGIWVGKEYLLPAESMLNGYDLDLETGILTAAASRFEYPENENDPVKAIRSICRLMPDGSSELWTDSPDTGEDYVGFLAFRGNAFYWSQETGTSLTIHRRGASGEETVTDPGSFFRNAVYTPTVSCLDRSGHIIVTAGDELVLLDDNLAFLSHVDLPGEVSAVRLSPDGSAVVYAAVGKREIMPQEHFDTVDLPLTEDGRLILFGAAVLDPETRTLGEFRQLPEDATLRAKRGNGESGSHSILHPASPSWDFCYTGQDGVYGASWDETGNLSAEKIFDWANSDITKGDYTLLRVYDADTMLFRGPRTDRGEERLVLFRHADDVRLSEMITLTVAHTVDISAQMQTKIADFNRTHPGVKVILKDYRPYDDKSTPTKNEGAEKLAFELSLGEAGADMVIAGGRADSAETGVILQNGLYRDLTPFLDADPAVNRDNLFGAVPRLYQTAEGNIWGLTDSLSVNTLIGSRKTLGTESGHLSAWTMSDMLDLAESLPEDTALTAGLYWGGLGTLHIRDLLGPEGWGAYLDWESGTCSFDSPEFVRFLTFLRSLPKDIEDFRRNAPDGKLDNNDNIGHTALYRSGRLALSISFFPAITSFPDVVRDFGSDDWVAVGYPDSGTNAVPGKSIMLLETCAEPELAWELLADLVRLKSSDGFVVTIPALKSDFSSVLDKMKDYVTAVYDDGSSRFWMHADEAPADPSQLEKPGTLFRWTQAFEDDILSLIDGAGSPLVYSVPNEVTDIIEEEISAMTAGVSTPERCAGIIQSRVGIWMAEHH